MDTDAHGCLTEGNRGNEAPKVFQIFVFSVCFCENLTALSGQINSCPSVFIRGKEEMADASTRAKRFYQGKSISENDVAQASRRQVPKGTGTMPQPAAETGCAT